MQCFLDRFCNRPRQQVFLHLIVKLQDELCQLVGILDDDLVTFLQIAYFVNNPEILERCWSMF